MTFKVTQDWHVYQNRFRYECAKSTTEVNEYRFPCECTNSTKENLAQIRYRPHLCFTDFFRRHAYQKQGYLEATADYSQAYLDDQLQEEAKKKETRKVWPISNLCREF